jgi:hypothetical protein
MFAEMPLHNRMVNKFAAPPLRFDFAFRRRNQTTFEAT